MALVKTYISGYELKREFEDWERDYFSIEACEEIVKYFEEFDENVELDIIGLCGDFTESTYEEIKHDYSNNNYIAQAETKEELIDALVFLTWVMPLSNGNILYMNF